jgi:FlaA1/EpsC-like NDP-sugar epimerase
MTVPMLNNVVGGKMSPARIRKVAVEDLMKRESSRSTTRASTTSSPARS